MVEILQWSFSVGYPVMTVGGIFWCFTNHRIINCNHRFVQKNLTALRHLILLWLCLELLFLFWWRKNRTEFENIVSKCKVLNSNFLFIEMLHTFCSLNICMSDFLKIWTNNNLEFGTMSIWNKIWNTVYLMLIKMVTSL